jgi:hypothetical protein
MQHGSLNPVTVQRGTERVHRALRKPRATSSVQLHWQPCASVHQVADLTQPPSEPQPHYAVVRC